MQSKANQRPRRRPVARHPGIYYRPQPGGRVGPPYEIAFLDSNGRRRWQVVHGSLDDAVFVVDAKNYKGRVEKRDKGGFFSTDYRLYVGGRDKTALVAGMTTQALAVRAALGDEDGSVRIYKAICFVDADWSLFARPIEMDSVHVLWPRALGKLLRTEGSLSRDEITRIERKLALALPAA